MSETLWSMRESVTVCLVTKINIKHLSINLLVENLPDFLFFILYCMIWDTQCNSNRLTSFVHFSGHNSDTMNFNEQATVIPG